MKSKEKMIEELIKLAAQIGELLQDAGGTVTTAESCTGGGISYFLTEVAGSSAWFDRAFVTYSDDSKQTLVGVQQATLDAHGAVSEEVVAEMANGALAVANADYSLAVSGLAGPTGKNDEKPIGIVCFGWATKVEVVTETCLFNGDRHIIRLNTIIHSLCHLQSYLMSQK